MKLRDIVNKPLQVAEAGQLYVAEDDGTRLAAGRSTNLHHDHDIFFKKLTLKVKRRAVRAANQLLLSFLKTPLT